jgi:hypothetical protein
MTNKTRFEINKEKHVTRPPRLKGKVKSAKEKNIKKKKKV